MQVPSLQPISTSHFCVSGDVTIHPTATIAAGVLLQADPDGRIIVGAGVCLGMGTVLHAHQGVLEVEAEVTVGTSVLIVGSGKIGANACIGSASTIWNQSVERGTVVPPLSLLGMPDRQADAVKHPDSTKHPDDTKRPVVESEAEPSSAPASSGLTVAAGSLNGVSPASQNGATVPAPPANQPTAEIQLSFSTPVYGQASLNRLLSTLLPHRHLFTPGQENLNQDDQNPPDPTSSG